jgi:hypothetical protein
MRIHHAVLSLALATFAIAAVAPAALTRAAPGQGGKPAGAGAAVAHAVVMQVANLRTAGARAIVVRRPGSGATRDMILVSPSTTARDLAQAVAALMASRRVKGAGVEREIRAIITPSASRTKRISRDEKHAARDLRRIRRGRVINIPGVGSGRAISIATSVRPPRN